MASSSDENTRDLLIYVFYDVDTPGIFPGKELPSLKTSDDLFPRIDEKKNFVNTFDFMIKKPHIRTDVRLTIAEYRSWVINKNSMIYRKDKINGVDVIYIWSYFITNHEDPVYKDFMRFLMFRPKKFVYMVKFCHNLLYFRNVDGFNTLQNMVNADLDTNDVSLFNKYRTQIILNVFVDDYFKNTSYDEGTSIEVFRHFLNDIGLPDVEHINPCFIMKPGDVSIEVISTPSVIKHTDFMFLDFHTYMSDIYSDCRVLSSSYPMKTPLINADMYMRRVVDFERKLTDYEQRLQNLNILLNRRNTENNALRDAIDRLTTELEEKKTKIKRLKESSQRPIGISGDMMAQIDDLQSQIVAFKREIKTLEEELDVEKGQNKELQRDHNNLLREFAKSQEEATRYKAKYEKMIEQREHEFEEEKQTEKEYRSIIEEKGQEIRQLMIRNEELSREKMAAENVIQELNDQLEAERSKRGEVMVDEPSKIEIEESFGSFEESLGDISIIEPAESKEVENIKQQISDIEHIKSTKINIIDDYKTMLRGGENHLQYLNARAKETSDIPTLMKYHDLIAKQQKENNDLTKKIEQEEHSLRTEIIEPEEGLIARLKQSEGSSLSETTILREDLALLQQEEAEKQQEIASKMAKIDDIQAEIVDINYMRNREPELSKTLQMEAKVEDLQRELEQERVAVNKAVDALQTEIEPLKKEVEELLEETTIDIPEEEESRSFISPEETEITFKHHDVFRITQDDMSGLYVTMNNNNNMWLSKGKRDLMNENMLMNQNVRLLSHSLRIVVPSNEPELLFEVPDSLDDFNLEIDPNLLKF